MSSERPLHIETKNFSIAAEASLKTDVCDRMTDDPAR